MAEQTSSGRRLDRGELGAALHRLADAFEGGDEEIDVEVGNEHVTLSPGETIDLAYPGGWIPATAIGVVAWVVATLILLGLGTLGVVTPDALGVPGA